MTLCCEVYYYLKVNTKPPDNQLQYQHIVWDQTWQKTTLNHLCYMYLVCCSSEVTCNYNNLPAESITSIIIVIPSRIILKIFDSYLRVYSEIAHDFFVLFLT